MIASELAWDAVLSTFDPAILEQRRSAARPLPSTQGKLPPRIRCDRAQSVPRAMTRRASAQTATVHNVKPVASLVTCPRGTGDPLAEGASATGREAQRRLRLGRH